MRQINVDSLKSKIEERMANDFENNNIDAVSLVVKQGGKTLYKNTFGNANDESIYRMASMTKPVTVVAIMTLFDKGLLDIDDLVETYLPEFSNLYLVEKTENGVEKTKPIKNKPTIKHLLTHTSGIMNGECGFYYETQMSEEDRRTLENSVNFYSSCGLSFEPFSKEEYSATAAFDVLSRVVEVLSGKNYSEYLEENIFKPCNMKNTTFAPSNEQWSKVVTMHDKRDGKNAVGNTCEGCVFENFPVSHYLGGAGLVSTLEDYSNFAEMLLNKGKFEGTRVISEKAVELISFPHVPKEIMGGNCRWGLGVRVITEDGYKLPLGTFGWSGAYGTHFWVDPVNKITAVYLKNSRFDGGAGAKTAENFELDVFNSLE